MDREASEILWLSLGENCLPDDFLKRHGRKSFSTPYSSGRSNIDYAITLENSNYRNLLEPENLTSSDAWGKAVVRSTLITQAEDIFELSCSRGFEFTHHNPLESPKDRESILRKISRLQTIRGKKDVVFLYHHRRTSKSDLPKLRRKLDEFRRLYDSDAATCFIALFYQDVDGTLSKTSIDTSVTSSHVIEFVFHSRLAWSGQDPDIFWARNDDDLVAEMIDQIDRFVQQDQMASMVSEATS